MEVIPGWATALCQSQYSTASHNSILSLELNSFPVAVWLLSTYRAFLWQHQRQLPLSFRGSRIYPVSFSDSWFLLFRDYSCPAVLFFSHSTSCLEITKLSWRYGALAEASGGQPFHVSLWGVWFTSISSHQVYTVAFIPLCFSTNVFPTVIF